MKRFLLLISLVSLFMVVGLTRVNAENYGISVDETGWQDKADGGKYFTQTYYVTRTTNGYVYLRLLENNNVKVTDDDVIGSNFTLISKNNTTVTSNGATITAVDYLLKLKDGVTISGKTELLKVNADILEPSILECDLSYSPLNTVCNQIGNLYFDKDGKSVTADEYNTSCNGYTPPVQDDIPDEPAATGPVIPYIAVGLGLVAIGGLYFYSRKSNKMFKI